MKNKWLAAALNLVPGIGYIYIGGARLVMGVMMLLFWATTVVVGIYSPTDSTPSGISDLIIGLAFVAVFVIDAYLEVDRLNKAQAKDKKA